MTSLDGSEVDSTVAGYAPSGNAVMAMARTTGSAAPAPSDGERRPAAAGGAGVGIADDELRTRQVLAVVDFRALQVLDAHRIHEQRDTRVLDLGGAGLHLLVEGEAVLEARAPAALYVDAELQAGIACALDQLIDLAGGRVREIHRRLVGRHLRFAHECSPPAATGGRGSLSGSGSATSSARRSLSWMSLPLTSAPTAISISEYRTLPMTRARGPSSTRSDARTSPLTVPFSSTWETLTVPSTQPRSLILSDDAVSPAATTLPRTYPSMWMPPENSISPWTRAPAPINVPIAGCL